MKAYPTDVRRQLVQAYQRRLGSQRALADAFGVSPSFVKKVLHRYRATAHLTPKPPNGGQKPRLDVTTQTMLQRLGLSRHQRRSASRWASSHGAPTTPQQC
jgi:transposase